MLLNNRHETLSRTLALGSLLLSLGMASAAQAEVTGNIGVYSKYVLRGIAEENSGAAVQGGLDYSHASGFYAGYWGSSLGYNYDASGEDGYTATGFENDLYLGFAGEAGSVSYDVGLIQYYYMSVDDSNLTEVKLGAGFGPVGLQAQYLATDGWWGNAGDIYWTVNYETKLPADFGLTASLGYYTYSDEDNEKLCTDCTTESAAFRHFNVGLTHPLGNSGAEMGITFIKAGLDRSGNQYDDTVVLNVSHSF